MSHTSSVLFSKILFFVVQIYEDFVFRHFGYRNTLPFSDCFISSTYSDIFSVFLLFFHRLSVITLIITSFRSLLVDVDQWDLINIESMFTDTSRNCRDLFNLLSHYFLKWRDWGEARDFNPVSRWRGRDMLEFAGYSHSCLVEWPRCLPDGAWLGSRTAIGCNSFLIWLLQ